MSEPLCHPDFPRLQTYSVFWSSSSALELWVGTSPRKPIQQSSFLTGATLLSTIIRFYGIRISEERRSSKLVRFAKRHWPQLVSYALLAVLVAGAFIYSYFRRGLVPWTFILPLIPIGTFLYHRFGPRLFGFVAYDLMFSLLLFFGLPYLVWSPPEHLPYGSDAEYPFLAGLAAATSLGVGVVLLQFILDREEESLAEMFRSRFRSLRRSLALMSVLTMAGYGAFLIHSYAVHQIFCRGQSHFRAVARFRCHRALRRFAGFVPPIITLLSEFLSLHRVPIRGVVLRVVPHDSVKSSRYSCLTAKLFYLSILVTLLAAIDWFYLGVGLWFYLCCGGRIGGVFVRSQGSGSGLQCRAVFHRLRRVRVLCAPF